MKEIYDRLSQIDRRLVELQRVSLNEDVQYGTRERARIEYESLMQERTRLARYAQYRRVK